jgi:hypothetical protein
MKVFLSLTQVTEATVKGATGPLVDGITDISKTLGVTREAGKTLLKIIGDDPNVPPSKPRRISAVDPRPQFTAPAALGSKWRAASPFGFRHADVRKYSAKLTALSSTLNIVSI